MMETAVQPANGNGAGPLPPEVGCRLCQGKGIQKRIRQLVRLRHELQTENSELRELLLKYEGTLEKYKQALRRARRVNAE